jgi:hypothetical protein
MNDAKNITAAKTDRMAITVDGCVGVWVWANGILVGAHVQQGEAEAVIAQVRNLLGNAVPTAIHLDYLTDGEDDLEAVIEELEKFTMVAATEEEYEWVAGQYAGFRFIGKVNAPGTTVRS